MGRIFSIILSCFLIPGFVFESQAAIEEKQVLLSPAKVLSGQGSSFGGVAGKGFTLLDFRRTADKKIKTERLVFDIGDKDGRVLSGAPGYYHVELQKNPHRLILDFSQMPHVNLNEEALMARLKDSLAVKNVKMSLEPIDQTLNMTMELKNSTRVHAYEVPGRKSTSKVVIDLLVQ